MRRIEKKPTINNPGTIELTEQASQEPVEAKGNDDGRKSISPLAVISIVVLFFVALFAVGGTLMYFRGSMISNRRGNIIEARGDMPRMRPMYVREASNISTSSTDQSVASGVVTSVNGKSFVIGGNGQKVIVNTSGSTTWNTADKKVSVNDSVVVIGTVSNSTVTATSVRIVNL